MKYVWLTIRNTVSAVALGSCPGSATYQAEIVA